MSLDWIYRNMPARELKAMKASGDIGHTTMRRLEFNGISASEFAAYADKRLMRDYGNASNPAGVIQFGSPIEVNALAQKLHMQQVAADLQRKLMEQPLFQDLREMGFDDAEEDERDLKAARQLGFDKESVTDQLAIVRYMLNSVVRELSAMRETVAKLGPGDSRLMSDEPCPTCDRPGGRKGAARCLSCAKGWTKTELEQARAVMAVPPSSTDDEAETKKALDRVLDDLPKGRIGSKDVDRLDDGVKRAKQNGAIGRAITGRKLNWSADE